MLPTILSIGIAAVIVMTVIGMAVGIYNRLVTYQNRYENAFSQIEVQLKRRYDLIPNLVETAKGYLEHERGTLEAVIKARNQAAAGLEAAASNPSNPTAMKSLAGAERAFVGRTMRDAPEVDGAVYLADTGLGSGDLVLARIEGVEDYDLRATVVNSET